MNGEVESEHRAVNNLKLNFMRYHINTGHLHLCVTHLVLLINISSFV